MTRIKPIALFCLLVVAASCSQSTNTVTPGTGKVPFLDVTTWNASNFSATFEIHKTNLTRIDSSSATLADVTATLWNSTANAPVGGGTVAVNGTALGLNDHTATGGGEYYTLNAANGQTVPMAYNGQTCRFSVSGSSDFSALSDSITFPNRDMSVSSPGVGLAISKASGFTISWDHNSPSTDSIFISIAGDSTGYVTYFVPDNGSFTVPSADLAPLTVGERAIVGVTRICYKVTQDANGRWYAMAAYASDQKYHMVTN